MPIITRFAPSPTGPLHLGHAYSAVLAHTAARQAKGRFVLRIEDIDSGRCRPRFVGAIVDDLRWLGLDWDGQPMIQSQRMEIYAAAIDTLDRMGLVYRCVCKRSDILQAAGAPQGPMGALYPGTCRGLSIGADDDRRWSWRLDIAKAQALTGPLVWHDAVAGAVRAAPEQLGDIVVARKDVQTSYHLAVTIDDAEQAVTHVVRGRDLFAATHVHRLLQAVLGLPTPAYHHHRLVIDRSGVRLAKRRDSPALTALRDAGVDGHALAEMLGSGRFPVGFGLEAP